MFLRIALVALALPAASLRVMGDGSPLLWWVTNPLVKVKALDPVPAHPPKTAELAAARNEFEPFQLVLRSDGREIPDLDIQFSDFRTEEGAKLASNHITVYLEQFLNVSRPSTLEGSEGMWPDPLVPRVDRYANEKRNAFPFTVHPGLNQPLWVEVFVPPATLPGKYIGSARVVRGETTEFTVPIHLTVWAFVLPSTSTLRSSFGLNGTALVKQHRGKYTDDEDLYSLTQTYAKAALWHRISIHGGSMVGPKYSYHQGEMQIDWKPYDAEVGRFLDGTIISSGEPLYGAQATSVELRRPATFPNEEQEMTYYAAWIKHFEQKGWSDRLFLYLWDEPAPQDLPKVLQRGRTALKGDPRIRNLVTTPFTKTVEEVVQIWTPLVNCLERKPNFGDFCASAPALDEYAREIQHGKSLWFYQSCASHGCNIQGGEYFNGWPSYMIDAPGTANRVMQWIAWKYQIQGELYFSTDEAYGERKDPWLDVRLFGGNGDGTLFYPGRPDRIGGHTDIPIESIRLKLIREGMEDHEYLILLEKLAGVKAAEEFAERIVKKPYVWESRPEVFLRVRQELGETLDRLVQGSHGR
jgi:hypothetical protein